ncbi:MAG: spondin domain-containing protein [Planctomycetota bacterium]
MNFSSRTLSLALLTGALSLSWNAAAGAQSCDHPLNATYRVTFDAAWSQQTHPTDFPGNPHFSPLIGSTHAGSFAFWEKGGLATNGIESMAETGSTSSLTQEINQAITAGNAEFLLTGAGINSPGSTSMTFDITSEFSAVTLVTMIAPSPDWFVGVDGLELFENNRWLDQVVVDLAAYDSGTDDGVQYTSSNANSNPAQPISEILGYPFGGVPIGTFTFTKLSSEDLSLCVDPLVTGQNASIQVSYGTPMENVVIMWSTSLGSTVINNGSWCVDFGINLPTGNPSAQIVSLGPCDGNGDYQILRQVPASASGLTIHMQAAEQNACPDARMSNIVSRVVQ